VLISGVTVLIALAGMLIAGTKIFTGMAVGTMIVVLCAMVARSRSSRRRSPGWETASTVGASPSSASGSTPQASHASGAWSSTASSADRCWRSASRAGSSLRPLCPC
jgi:hypothetical protein